MPTCRRKRVVITELPQALLDAGDKNANRQVYYLAQTGEIFQSYEAYAARISFYRMRQFQCEVTGKSNLTYFEALESELQEARTMHSRFPEPLKASILRAVQWQVMGRLDHLVDAVYDRFKDRYFPEERVLVDIQGDKYFARIAAVFPPRVDAALRTSTSTDQRIPLHVIGGDLNIPTKDAMDKDDPGRYLYQIQIIDEERSSDSKLSVKDRETRETNRAKWSASLMEVQCPVLSRDRLAFSKSILRRFIRDCVDRDAALASPWTVKQAIAERFGVPTVMPDDTRKGVETIKKGEIEKRKKVWEEKEGPPSKKQKKADARAEALALAAEIRARDGDKAKAEAEAAEKKKKKPIRYPTEDLDVKLTDKEIKAGARLLRPVPSRFTLPFGRYFETFLMTWNFLVTYGHTLHLSTFTLDDFEHALRHSVADPACTLLAEVHSTLIYNLRTVPFTRHSAVLSLLHHKENQKVSVDSDDEESNEGLDVSVDDLATAIADIGNSWERVPLRHSEGREGWQDALVGCLKDHADLDKFPRLRQVLTRLVFAPQDEAEETTSSAGSPHSRHTPVPLTVASIPAKRYHTLSPEDKIDILSFLCNVAVSSKAVHAHMETSEEHLTALRKEKIEVNRTRKQYKEDIAAIVGEKPEGEKGESSDLSDVPSESENASESGNGKSRRRTAGETAKQRQAARAKIASAKQAQAEQRRLEEELAKLDRRIEGIEREFRKLLGVVRARPLGKDRFHNRVWWLDGLGSASLIGSGGSVLYGTGRLFIQGPSVFDVDLLKRRQVEEQDLERRRDEEEGPEGQLGVGEWAVYEDIEDVTDFITWLNPKGVRELGLKNAITKWWNNIAPGMKKRTADLGTQAKIPDARRSSRVKVGPNSDLAREPYMLWTNRRAVNAA